MHTTKNDLANETRMKVSELCNARLMDCLDLQGQIKQAHWMVKGPNFIGLHLLFDTIYEAVQEYADLIAERAIQLGGTVSGTAKAVSEGSQLPEYPLEIVSCADHVASLSTALASFGKLVREGIEQADALGDQDAADIFTEVSRGIDKWLWFVEAHSQSEN